MSCVAAVCVDAREGELRREGFSLTQPHTHPPIPPQRHAPPDFDIAEADYMRMGKTQGELIFSGYPW